MIALAVLAAGVITSGVSGTHSFVLGTEVGMKPVKE
jgi:hypothetical protein